MNDEQFENYLKEFEPKKPRTLPELKAPAANWRRFAAAAAVILLCGTSVWRGFREKPTVGIVLSSIPQKPATDKTAGERKKTAFELKKAALEDSAKFEAMLVRESQEALPGFSARDSALHALAKE